MKKLFNITLIMAMILSMSLTVFADSPFSQEDTKDVTGIFVEGAKSDIVYSVDVSWGSMEFTFIDESEGIWNPLTHTFDDVVDSTWNLTDESNKITITNHSNDNIIATMSFSSSIANVEGGFYEESSGLTPITSSILLENANGTQIDTAPTSSVYFNITDGTITENGTIGTITITLGEPNIV